MTLPLAPFPADSPVQRFYLSADEAFGAGSARLTMQVQPVPAGGWRRCPAQLALSGRRPVAAAGAVEQRRRADGRHQLRLPRRHQGIHPGWRDQLPRSHVVAVQPLSQPHRALAPYRRRERTVRDSAHGRHPGSGVRMAAAANGRHHGHSPAWPARRSRATIRRVLQRQRARCEQGLLSVRPAATIQRHVLYRLPGGAGQTGRDHQTQRDFEQPFVGSGHPGTTTGPDPGQSPDHLGGVGRQPVARRVRGLPLHS